MIEGKILLIYLIFLCFTLVSAQEVDVDQASEDSCDHEKFRQYTPQYGMHLICASPIDANSTEVRV
jgi:hypothetical protein